MAPAVSAALDALALQCDAPAALDNPSDSAISRERSGSGTSTGSGAAHGATPPRVCTGDSHGAFVGWLHGWSVTSAVARCRAEMNRLVEEGVAKHNADNGRRASSRKAFFAAPGADELVVGAIIALQCNADDALASVVDLTVACSRCAAASMPDAEGSARMAPRIRMDRDGATELIGGS